MAKYRKKPLVIDAIKYTGDNKEECCLFMMLHTIAWDKNDNGLFINTLEGMIKASVGDYIIKGTKGEYYGIKEDIFLESYEIVEDQNGTI